MSSEQSLSIADEPSPKSAALSPTKIERPARHDAEKTSRPLPSRTAELGTFTERMKSYFTTHEGRVVLASLSFTLVCVLLQHIMGTCQHSVSDDKALVQWHVFTPPCMLANLPCRRKDVLSSRSWSSYGRLLLRSFVDDSCLLSRTRLDAPDERRASVEKARSHRPRHHRPSLSPCPWFQYLG